MELLYLKFDIMYTRLSSSRPIDTVILEEKGLDVEL